MWRIVFLGSIFLVSLLTGLLGSYFFRWLAKKINFLDRPLREQHKQHQQPIPLLGGMALLCGWFLMVWGGIILFRFLPSEFFDQLGIGISWNDIYPRLHLITIISLGALGMGGIGLKDDYSPLNWMQKLILQAIVCGLIVLHPLLQFSLFLTDTWIRWGVTWVFFMFFINAFNFFDNMDGLAAGVALITSSLFSVVAGLHGNWLVCCLGIVTAGLCGGYYILNRYPATIYMGDCGSLFLGFMLAVQAVLTTFWKVGTLTVAPFLIPLLILGVPIFDLFVVFWIRWRSGKSLFIGDHNHISHRFVRMGFSRDKAVLLVHLLTLGVGLGSLHLLYVDTIGVIFTFLQTLVILGIVVVLHTFTNHRPSNGSGS